MYVDFHNEDKTILHPEPSYSFHENSHTWEDRIIISHILVRSQNGPQHWNIATLLKLTHWENKCIHIAHCQYHGCWCHEDARSHVIDNLGFELVCPEYHALSTGRVNPSLHESRRFPFVHHWLTPRTMYELRSIGRLCINAPPCICVFLSACINADIYPVYSVVYMHLSNQKSKIMIIQDYQ